MVAEKKKAEEKKVEDKKPDTPPAPAKKLTQTPEPINPVRTDGAVDKDPNQMNAKEYRAWRERNR